MLDTWPMMRNDGWMARFLAMLLLGCFLLHAPAWAGEVDSALDRAGENREQIQQALDQVPDDQRLGMEWLVTHMPEEDLRTLDATFLLENCQYAYAAWREAPWHEEVSEEMFFEAILPYASINERRDNWRADFRERFAHHVSEATTPSEAAAILNNEMYGQVGVIYSTKRPKADQSPYESIDAGLASCTGLTVLLVDACRSQGIPARFVGTPLWSDGSGNHSWVEVWDDGWHFTGAAEPTGMELDKAWFSGRAGTADRTDPINGIYAATWAKSPIHFPMSWRLHDETVGGIDVTDRYTVDRQPVPEGMARVRFKAVGPGDERIMVPLRISGQGMEPIETSTRDERFDGNDHVTVLLPSDTPVTADFRHGAGTMDFVVAEDEQLAVIKLPDTQPFSEEQARSTRTSMLRRHAQLVRDQRAAEHEARTLTIGEHEMPFWYTIYGEKPEGGRSLYISMHGGGGAPAEVNDSQWENQKKLYTPEEGVYLAPRAPTNTWNLWHQGHIDDFYDRLIENMIVFEDVNPDRVYIMGYSAGGDGVYQLAPRMADRLAAAAMMAGHPNETRPDGLRNLPFALHMGGEDSAYDRNRIGREWKAKLAQLAEADPGGYPHQAQIHEGKGHWMDKKDAVALPWMAQHDRNRYPEKITWLQDDVTHGRFYWLAVDTPVARQRIVVERDGQVFRIIESGGAEQIRLRLNDEMVDMDRPVIVMQEGRELFRGIVPRTYETMSRTLAERGDPLGIYTGELIVEPVDSAHGYKEGSVDVEVDGDARAYPYRIRRPDRIAEGERLPLVVFLHGAGERGDDNVSQLKYFPQRAFSEEHLLRHRCIVLAPQCPSGESWVEFDHPYEASMKQEEAAPAMQAAIAAVQRVLEQEPVDPFRVYLVGLSMGGYGTWDLAARHPELFAAIVPICGGGDPATASQLASVPTWAFHGTADTVVPEVRTVEMVEAIQDAGGSPKYSALEGVGHNSWSTAFGPEGGMDWMFDQQRPTICEPAP